MKEKVLFSIPRFVLLAILIVIIGIVGFLVFVGSEMNPTGGAEITVEIPAGYTGKDVASLLHKDKLIKNEFMFRALLRDANFGVKAGKYNLNGNMTPKEILEALKHPQFDLPMLSFPEGLTVKEMAQLLDRAAYCSETDFLQAVKKNSFQVNGKNIKSIEGFLFPETYNFAPDWTPYQIASRMVKEFDTRVSPLYNAQAGKLPFKLSLEQVTVLASLVEREARLDSERPIIAGVYYNRLKKGMKLDCDATVLYALGSKKETLLYSDLEIDSPYNTYKYAGLPPTPICSPGLAAIKATLSPAHHNYLYYVRNDKKNDGSHVFSATLQEHENAIKKYQNR